MEELRGCAGVGKAPPWAPSGVGTSAPTTNLNRKKKKKTKYREIPKKRKNKKKGNTGDQTGGDPKKLTGEGGARP